MNLVRFACSWLAVSSVAVVLSLTVLAPSEAEYLDGQSAVPPLLWGLAGVLFAACAVWPTRLLGTAGRRVRLSALLVVALVIGGLGGATGLLLNAVGAAALVVAVIRHT